MPMRWPTSLTFPSPEEDDIRKSNRGAPNAKTGFFPGDPLSIWGVGGLALGGRDYLLNPSNFVAVASAKSLTVCGFSGKPLDFPKS